MASKGDVKPPRTLRKRNGKQGKEKEKRKGQLTHNRMLPKKETEEEEGSATLKRGNYDVRDSQ